MNSDHTMKTLGCQQTVGQDNINAFVRDEDTKEISCQFKKREKWKLKDSRKN